MSTFDERRLQAAVIAGREKNTLAQCQEIAKELGHDSVTFELCGPKAKLKCKWLDAYYGFFTIDGQDGFIRAQEFVYNDDVWCENIQYPPVKLEGGTR